MSTTTRPSRKAAVAPAPVQGCSYCHTCGRIITPRKSQQKPHSQSQSPHHPSTPQKYCSDRCRREKPRRGDPTSTEARIERKFVEALDDGSGGRIVLCGEVEGAVFGSGDGGAHGGGGEREGSGDEDDSAAAAEDDDDDGDGGVVIPHHHRQQQLVQSPSAASVSASANKKSETQPYADPRLQGMRRARQREMVRQAARRGVAFGFAAGGDGGEGEARRRGVEAVQGGRVVEASFAKGEWGVRWRTG